MPQRDAAKDKSKVKAHVYEKLLFRHWNAWSDGKRSHLFVVPAKGGTPRDLTPGADYDVPPFNLGEPGSHRIFARQQRTRLHRQHR